MELWYRKNPWEELERLHLKKPHGTGGHKTLEKRNVVSKMRNRRVEK